MEGERSPRNFLWWCAGAVPEVIRLYPTEKTKYEGIGGAVLTTGVLAFLSGFYAIYTTIATGAYSVLIAIGFGILWGLAVFNLDRYIVSSLRKPTDPATRWQQRLTATWLPALPRLGLAILIGITLSKPLELRLFHNAIAVQSAINRDNTLAARRATLTASSRLSELDTELARLNTEISTAENLAQRLETEFRAETDGTGGSLRYGYSDVARVKEAGAVQARQAATQARNAIEPRIRQFQAERDQVSADIERQTGEFRTGLTDDFLTQMTALGDLSANNTTVWWVSTFVTMLLIGIEITPVIVKLLSPIGPYDVKLDAMNSVETTEALLQRDATIRALVDRYDHYSSGPQVPGS